MSRLADPPVGERIREERIKRRMSLRGLARAVGVSPSLISQIETGKCRPSVSTLYAITTALGVSIEDVFEVPGEAAGLPVAVSRAAGTAGGLGAGGHRPRVLMRTGEREVLRLDTGVTWERLGHVPGTRADFLLVTYPAGASSSSDGQLMRHPGTEYSYLMRGELVLTLGREEHHIVPGNSLSFASSIPHRYRNGGSRPAVGIWFVTD